MSEAKGEFPKICELCEKKIGSRIDLDWHGLGNCVPICETCNGSGIAKTGEPLTFDEWWKTVPGYHETGVYAGLYKDLAKAAWNAALAAQGAPGTREQQ
jgi:hypothetical protein